MVGGTQRKGRLPSRCSDSLDDTVGDQDDMNVSDDGAGSVGGQSGLLQKYNETSGERIGALGATLNRVAKMVEMLDVAGGLASPARRLVVVRHRVRMERAWDESVS